MSLVHVAAVKNTKTAAVETRKRSLLMSFSQNSKNSLVYLTSSKIDTVHAFTTRYGGVSDGIYSSLNLSVKSLDTRENIQKNYEILCGALGIPLEKLVYTNQVHSDIIDHVTKKDSRGIFEKTDRERDGLMTNVPGLPLIAYTADCIPILFHDPVAGAIAAVHAGWRGSVNDIVGKTVNKMCALYGSKPENIRCAIGPGISKCCFETDKDVPDAVIVALGADGEKLIEKKGDKFFVDIKGVNAALLEKAGVRKDNIDISDECTMCSHEKYWSHRYTKGNRGCQACIIMLRG